MPALPVFALKPRSTMSLKACGKGEAGGGRDDQTDERDDEFGPVGAHEAPYEAQFGEIAARRRRFGGGRGDGLGERGGGGGGGHGARVSRRCAGAEAARGCGAAFAP